MIDRITNNPQYDQVMILIETFIKKATDNGGLSFLSIVETQELSRLSSLPEQYEDNVLRIMPL